MGLLEATINQQIAHKLKEHIEDYEYHSQFWGALVAKTSLQSVPSGTRKAIEWDLVEEEVGEFYDPSRPTRLTVPAGVARVRVATNFMFGTEVSGDVIFEIRINGTNQIATKVPFLRMVAPGGYFINNICSPPIRVNEGDYFEVCVRHSQSSPLDVGSLNNHPSWVRVNWFSLEVIEWTPNFIHG